MKLKDEYLKEFKKFNGKIHSEEKAITAWLPAKDMDWLLRLKRRIEKEVDQPRKCEILHHYKNRKLRYALFYRDGYYKCDKELYYWQNT